jgi:predicted Zn-dependent peptidase
MKFKFLHLLTLILVSASMYSQSVKYGFEEFTLPNGLQVIMHKDNSTPIVAMSVMYHVGSKNEEPKRSGFAHFFEHLLFEGSENIERGQFDKYVEKAGGTLNANTTYDRTYYFEILPSNQLELGIWLESERMLHAKVENKGIETQREVVKEERRQRIDNQPYGSILEESMKRAYKVHPYKTSVIGSMEDLSAAQEADYKNFYKKFYVPNNAIVSIAGDIDYATTKKWVTDYFGVIPRGADVIQPKAVEPALVGETRDTIFDNIQLPAVVQTYRIPAQGTPDFYAVSLLSQLLSQGESSRFNKSLVDEKQISVFAGSFPLNLEHPGVNIVYSICALGKDPKEVEEAMDAEVKKIQTELIPEKEFQKLKNQVENDFIQNNSRVAGIAESLANYKMYFGDANLINTELDRYLKVTREDIQNAAIKYFNPKNRVALYYLPKQGAP